MNLAHLLLRSARWLPEQPAIALGTRTVLTYGELALRVSRLASGLKSKLNLAAGDRVALAMRNCPEYHQTLFACWHAGLTAVPMNAKLHAKEFAYILENSGARACFVTPDLGASVPRGISSEELPKLLADPSSPADVAPDDAAWLFYTSGTTGVPKGAVLTHRNLMFQTHAYFADIDPLGPGDSVLHPAPLSHGSGCYALPNFAAGAANVIPESGGFDAEEIFALLEHWPMVLMDEVGRGTSTFDGLALAWAIARHLVQGNKSLSLFATHYFEMTRLALEYREVANVHLDAVEHKDTVVFLHAVEEGPASQSYGLQVAALAGVPKAVVRQAKKYLQLLEDAAVMRGGQTDLFSTTKEIEPEPAGDALREELAKHNPDELSPREALELLYRLKKL